MKISNESQRTSPGKCSSSMSKAVQNRLLQQECSDSSSRFLTSKSESYVYHQLRLKKNSLPCRESDSKKRLVPLPQTPRQPKEVLRGSLLRLKSSQWTESVCGLKNLVQISRFHSQLLQKHLPMVYEEMTSLVQHYRTTAIRTACQAANEIFANVQPFEGVQLDDLVCALLQRTSDTNPMIRDDASGALDSLFLRIPPSIALKILLSKRILSLSDSAKLSATKLLVCAVHSLGTNSFSKDLKTRLVNATVHLLQEDCFEIKVHGMDLVTMFMQNEDFTNIFQKKFSNPTRRKVDRTKSTGTP